MLIKDQFLLQHISYKKRCQCFQRKLRQFSADITSVPKYHHNFPRMSSELSSEVCEDDRTWLRISSEWSNQVFSRNLSRYQPQTPWGYHQDFLIPAQGIKRISYHQSFRRTTSENYYRDRFFKIWERQRFKPFGFGRLGRLSSDLFVRYWRPRANMNMLFFHEAFVRLTFRDYGNNW